MRFSDLKSKEVVRLEDGKKLGFVDDLIFDETVANVVALRIPLQSKMFKKPEYLTIDIGSIEKIGENVILVKMNQESLCHEERGSKFYYSPKVFKKLSDKTNTR